MATKKEQPDDSMKAVAAAMGKRGGEARAKALSAKRRKEIGRAAAEARWGKKDK